MTSLQEIEKAVADRDIESLESLSNYVFDFCTGQVGDPALREMMDEYGYMVQVKMASGEASNLPRHNLPNLIISHMISWSLLCLSVVLY